MSSSGLVAVTLVDEVAGATHLACTVRGIFNNVSGLVSIIILHISASTINECVVGPVTLRAIVSVQYHRIALNLLQAVGALSVSLHWSPARAAHQSKRAPKNASFYHHSVTLYHLVASQKLTEWCHSLSAAVMTTYYTHPSDTAAAGD